MQKRRAPPARVELLAGLGWALWRLAGTGVRPDEGFGADWPDVDVKRRVLRVRRGFAKGR